MKMKIRIALVLLLAAFVCLAAPASLADEVYVTTSSGSFLLYNTLTGAFTVLGTSSTALFGMGPSGGVLYANDSGKAPLTGFYTVNPANGALTPVAKISGSTILGRGTLAGPVAGGTLYYMDHSNNLYTINPSNGVATAVGALGFAVGGGFDLAFTQSGHLYGASLGNLYSINASTGAGTLIGPTDFGTTQLDLQAVIEGDGTLYGFHGANMYSIDLNTGALTFIRTTPDPTNLGVFFDGTPVLTPEPSALSLLATSMFVFISLAAWRKVTCANV
jgi:hypothetical protein